MIRKIRTFYGKKKGQHGARETTVSMGVAWLCEKCGEVILYEHLTPKHFCKRPITPLVYPEQPES
jgi:hypothetical protein